MNNDESVTLSCHLYYLRFEMVSSRYIFLNDSYKLFINNKCYVHYFLIFYKKETHYLLKNGIHVYNTIYLF